MAQYHIEYSTIEQQLEKLTSQGLIISDVDFAYSQLKCYGYSNLIKSYREPYSIIENGIRKYRSGVTFEQIASLHELDKNIRNSVMASMQDLEEHFKEVSADVIAHSFGTNQEDYLKYRNYQNKRKSIEKFQLGSILDSLRAQLESPKDPIHHYYTNYGVVPPWILFKSIYFSTMVNFIDQFKASEQTETMMRLLDFEHLNITEDNARMLMMDILFVSMEYRNNAAHGGRMYDFVPKNRIRTSNILGDCYRDCNPQFAELIELLNFFRYKDPFNQLHKTLSQEVNRHCCLFPQDVTYLGQILNIDIVLHSIVYISGKTMKFHSSPNCSGMTNPIEIELEDAVKKGYCPCKRCTSQTK